MPSETTFAFKHIPTLLELLRGGGTAGVKYAQVCSHNVNRAREEGWRLVTSESFYRIEGPKGVAEMALMKRGEPIPGEATGARIHQCDPDILTLTGLNPNPTVLHTKETPSGKVDVQTGKVAQRAQGAQGDVRVPQGDPA